MRKKPTDVTVTIDDLAVERPLGVSATPPIDHGKHLEYAKQLAQQDHAARPNDIGWIQYFGEGLLPVEQEERERLAAAQTEANLRIEQARSTAAILEKMADVNLVVTASNLPGPMKTTISDEDKEVGRIDGRIDEANRERSHLEDILRGNACDEEDISWPGPVPPPPTSDTTHHDITRSAANLRNKALVWLPYLILGVIDLVIIVSNVKDYLRSDSYLLPLVMSVALAAGQILLPSWLGRKLAETYRRGSIQSREVALLAVGFVGWVACIAAVTTFRVLADRENAVRKAAEEQQTTIDQIDPNAVFKPMTGILLWSVPVAIIGVIVIILMVLFHNPTVAKILKTDHTLVDLYQSRRFHEIVVEKAKACVAATIQASKDTISQLEYERDYVLPKQSNEFCQRYRRCLDLEYKDPAVTMALFPNSDESSINVSGTEKAPSFEDTRRDDEIIDGEVVS